MSSHSAPTRTLPNKPSLAQLRKQAKELLKSYRAGKDAAVAEVERFERRPDPANFALADAQRVLARAYGFSSWVKLKQHVEGAYSARVAQRDLRRGVSIVPSRVGQAVPDAERPRVNIASGGLRELNPRWSATRRRQRPDSIWERHRRHAV